MTDLRVRRFGREPVTTIAGRVAPTTINGRRPVTEIAGREPPNDVGPAIFYHHHARDDVLGLSDAVIVELTPQGGFARIADVLGLTVSKHGKRTNLPQCHVLRVAPGHRSICSNPWCGV
jgi:hypothetical protein